jgi:Na+-transporting NADH:ubiquinone oxidoreductase subunit C
MKDKPYYAIIFMFFITAFFSSILIGFSRFTRPLVLANERLAFEKAVLAVLPVNLPDNPSNLQMHQAFVEQVTEPTEYSDGAFLLIKDDKIAGYALPVDGQGFWAPIAGIIGIRPDRQTIHRIAIYEQNETPGLGAEITQDKFCDQFIELSIADSNQPIRIMPVSRNLQNNEVHAVTGATQTSTRLEKLINEDLRRWQLTVSSREDSP